MKTQLVDAIANVRIVSGTIRMDIMNITGQNEDKTFVFEKNSEIAMTPLAFNQALNMMKSVEGELKKRSEEANEKKAK